MRSPATCHPDKFRVVKTGLCGACYLRTRYQNDSEYRERVKRWGKEYRSKNRNTVHVRFVLRQYGLTKDEYDALLKRSAGLCESCKQNPAAHVDHDHQSGEVRGLLCGYCNVGLGNFRDDPALLRKAIAYLAEHGRV